MFQKLFLDSKQEISVVIENLIRSSNNVNIVVKSLLRPLNSCA